MIATKEQERKALEQIRKIVEGLGENSYVGTALEGMLEDAEENIENDFALSWKSRAELATEKYEKAKADLEKLHDKMEQTQRSYEYIKGSYLEESERVFKYQTLYNEAATNSCERLAKMNEYKKVIEEQELEMIKLKARLCDLIEK